MTFRRAHPPGTKPTLPGVWRPTDVQDYWISSDGRVWSAKSDKVMKQNYRHAGGYAQVRLIQPDGHAALRYIHSLILAAFVGPRPDGHVACHKDGNPRNNTVDNLMWGTYSTNAEHRVAHGRHHNAEKDACPRGHAYSGDNLYLAPRSDGTLFRQCRECVRINGAAYRARKTAKADAA